MNIERSGKRALQEAVLRILYENTCDEINILRFEYERRQTGRQHKLGSRMEELKLG